MERQICSNVMCSVYVFGASADKCPGCGNLGQKMSPQQDEQFVFLYRNVQADL